MRLGQVLPLFTLLLATAAWGQGGAPGKPEAPPACPDNMIGLTAPGTALDCGCSAEATSNTATIWGTGPYTADSPICPAARHAGAIAAAGGRIRVRASGPRASFAGSSQNGVTTVEYGPYDASFTIEAAQANAAPAACPPNMQPFANREVSLTCSCPAPGNGAVWGTDTYTSDSDVCRAALHSGYVTRQGGLVRLRMTPGLDRYQGSARNGITTQPYPAYGASFVFEGQRVADGPPAGPPLCPDTMQSETARSEPLLCVCPAEATRDTGTFWGTDAYTADSRTCPAALHAGAVRRGGGTVTIRMLGGLPRYVGTTRNGVSSQNYGPYDASFRFEGVAAQGPQLCPDNMTAFAGGNDKLECLCTGEAVLRPGAVWGSNPYTADSLTCRAARHAGVAPVTGGLVRLAMQPGLPRYAASNRNGVGTSDYGAYPASFIFEGAQNVAAGAPVQAPVADALRRQGRVSLYITFRTNSADLDIAAAPVLTQVRDAMAADPGLRLRLVGHTDAQGTPAANLPLSQRRALAVATWLAQNGVAPARLAAEGRGQTQPIADNATEAGRSLNRRVEAERLD